MNAGSMDDKQVRVVNVDAECVLAVLFFPNGQVDFKARGVSGEEAAAMLRAAADAIESKRAGR